MNTVPAGTEGLTSPPEGRVWSKGSTLTALHCNYKQTLKFRGGDRTVKVKTGLQQKAGGTNLTGKCALRNYGSEES